MERNLSMRTTLTALTLLVASALFLPGLSRAQEAGEEILPYLQLGPVIVRPVLTLKETYRDNVYYTPDDITGDFITSVMPGVSLVLPVRMHELALGANAEIMKYAENSDLDVTPYQVFGRGSFLFGDRVSLKVGDTYQKHEESPLDSPNGTADVYTTNAAAISVAYAFVDVAHAQFDYTWTALDFVDSSYRTRDEGLVVVSLHYRVLPNTSAFLEYDFTNVVYDTAAQHDNDVQSGLVGATWEITEDSRGTAKAGFLAKNYADAAVEDYTTWTASADIRHRLTDAASVQVLGKRDVNEGKQINQRYFTTTGLFVDFTYRFLDRLTGTLEGSYAREVYSDPPSGAVAVREDTTARAGIGAKYSFNSWLDFSLGYSYLNRDSNYGAYSATVNAVTFAVTAYR